MDKNKTRESWFDITHPVIDRVGRATSVTSPLRRQRTYQRLRMTCFRPSGRSAARPGRERLFSSPNLAPSRGLPLVSFAECRNGRTCQRIYDRTILAIARIGKAMSERECELSRADRYNREVMWHVADRLRRAGMEHLIKHIEPFLAVDEEQAE